MILDGKSVVITGVGAGLGSEMARAALRDGALVTLAARSEAKLEEIAKELDPSGERVETQRCDITQEADCAALVAAASKRFGRVDGLIQVAAYEGAFGEVTEAELDRWKQSFDTNVIGAVNAVRAVVPALKQAGGGSIVLIGSQSSLVPQLPQAGYAASKGALQSTMYYLTKELGPDKIRVNTVVPSWMWGPPVQAFIQMQAKAEKRDEKDVLAGITAQIPLGHMVPDEDVAEAAIFLTSDRARSISGQSLMVNGGELMS